MSQTQVILDHLLLGEVITPLRAFHLTGGLAAHSRIAEIRSMGYTVLCQVKHEGRRKFGEYRLSPKSLDTPKP